MPISTITPWEFEEELTSDRMNQMVGEANQIDTSTKNSLEAHKADNANKAHGGFKGAYVMLQNVSQSIPSGTSTNKILFDTVVYDTANLWDTGNYRFIIPTGVSKVRVGTNLRLGAITGEIIVTLVKSGSNYGAFQERRKVTDILYLGPKASGVVDVVGGDYFELTFAQVSGAPKDIVASSGTWFSLEVVE